MIPRTKEERLGIISSLEPLSPTSQTLLKGMLDEHLGYADKDSSIKWREGCKVFSESTPSVTTSIKDLVDLGSTEIETNVADLAEKKRGATKVHHYIHPYKFSKEMIPTFKVFRVLEARKHSCYAYSMLGSEHLSFRVENVIHRQ